jgi:hypothetical protein
MRPLSASQALAPAFRRTRQLLYRPFRWSSHLKLTLAAVLAEGILVSFRYVAPGTLALELPSIPDSYRHARGFWVLAAVAGLLLLDLTILAVYSLARLRFAVFHCAHGLDRSLLPGWKLYEKQAARFFRAQVAVGFGIAGLVTILVVAAALVVFSVLTLRTPEGKYDTGVFLTLFFPTLGFAAFVLILIVVTQMVLNDFILPHMALENATLREAWKSVRPRIRADRESFFSYFLLRVLIFIVAVPILACLAFLVLWPVFWVLGSSATGYAALLEDATGPLSWVRAGLNILFIGLSAATGAAGAALLGGPLAIFLRCHAMYFYGSRFAPLSEALFPRRADTESVQPT